MEPGNWGCEYGGPMFLIPGIVITWYVTKTRIPDAVATEIKNYILARAHPADGGWGLHIEADSSVFGTALNYVVLRILGLAAEHPAMIRARGTLHKLGGATHAPHWAKFWLAVLGVSGWDMVNPVPTELWLLPSWIPLAPGRWWVHIRQVFLPVSFIYARRWTFEGTALTRELRDELFVEPWAAIDWAAHRNSISAADNYHPKSLVLNTVNWLLVNVWQPYLRPRALANRAEAWVSELVDYEDRNTDYACLAPVNAPMNTLVTYIRDGPAGYAFRRHVERLPEYLWVKGEGMLVNGTNGLQNWDAAFLIQAVVAAGLATDDRWRPMLTRALGYLDRHQLREDCADQERCFRHQRKGAWTFSNRDQGYAVSDCVSECIKAVIMLQRTDGYPRLLDDRRIFDAIDTILTYQNASGGVASYELQRSGEWLEYFNAAEVFGRIMVEYDYPECTTACVTALALFREHWPEYRAADVARFVSRAVAWIKTNQRADGSWYGSWGICFTYAGMFALESLRHIGETYENSEHARRGCDFFISKQRADGGWSESYKVRWVETTQ
jgi:lanosterol synthase